MDRITIEGGHSLRGEVTISGSKNAALPIMAAALLGDGPSIIRNVPDLRDTRTMAQVLVALGAKVEFSREILKIDPAGFSVTEAPYDMVRKMRASIYVLTPMIAKLGHARVSQPGGCAIGPRPIDLHLRGIEALGAHVALDHGNMVATNNGMKGAEVSLAGTHGTSVGATANTLMLASLTPGETTIRGAAREPEVMDLVGFLRAMGAKIEGEGTSTVKVQGVDRLKGCEYNVIPDRIEAGTFLTAAAITEGDVKIKGARADHMEATIEKLQEMGVYVAQENGWIRAACDGPLRAAPIQTLPYPGFPTDMQAQFMAALSIADGDSVVTETIYEERFIHVAELNRMGARISVTAGQATIHGVKKLFGAPVMASDLRASAALVVAGLAAEGVTDIHRVYHIDRGYERIEEKLQGMGANVERVMTERPAPDSRVVH